jgi:hypothetical protein
MQHDAENPLKPFSLKEKILRETSANRIILERVVIQYIHTG